MFLFCALIFMWYQGLDFPTALLGAVSTITTIGIFAPDIRIMGPVQQFLLILVFIVSVGLAASLLQGIVSATIKSGFQTDDLVRRMAKGMENHVIVVGYRFLGKYVVESLQRLKVEFFVITRNEGQMDILKSNNIPAPYSPITRVYEAFKKANIEKASILISTLEDDDENMLTVQTAKRLNNNIKTISIVNDRELVEGVKSAGADIVIPHFEIMGQILATSSLSKEMAGVFFSDDLRSKYVAEFKIEASGITYGALKGICPILVVSRGGEFIYDMKDSFQLKEGDFIHVLVDHESLGAFRDRLNSFSVPKKY